MPAKAGDTVGTLKHATINEREPMSQVIDLPKRRKRAPIAVSGKVGLPRRKPNHETRTREYLTPAEMETSLQTTDSAAE